MKAYKILFCLVTGLIITFLVSCKKDEEKPEEEDPQVALNKEITQWMYEVMDQVYFWNSFLPAYESVKDITDPEVFFNNLLYDKEDRWSWLTDDYESLLEEFSGTPTSMGIAPVFGRFYNSDNVFIIVSYVYPGSPAYRAGIKRGDIILQIDSRNLTTANYYTLFQQSSYTVTLGRYSDGSISTTSVVIPLTAEVIDSNPVIFDTIFSISEHKIGYMVYVEFISGNEGNLLEDFGSTIDSFENEGVTDLVMDIRYNPGGEITAANYLASCLAPENTVSGKNVFVKFLYNSEVQSYYEAYEGENSSNLVNRFAPTGHNLNISSVYFLTGENTASASELLMIGLKPYMNIIQIGDSTYGKYTGAWVMADTNDPPKHNWAIVPIVSKYSNSVGFTDFKDGLAPDYYIPDDLLEAKQFGDKSDPMLNQAIETITGLSGSTKKTIPEKAQFIRLPDPSRTLKTNLFLEPK